MKTKKMEKYAECHGNYRYSLTSGQQAQVQLFLRLLPEEYTRTEAWRLLHALTYAEDWSETPEYDVPKIGGAA